MNLIKDEIIRDKQLTGYPFSLGLKPEKNGKYHEAYPRRRFLCFAEKGGGGLPSRTFRPVKVKGPCPTRAGHPRLHKGKRLGTIRG